MQQHERKIAFIHNDFPAGGAERVTMDIANYLVSFGYKIYIFIGKYNPASLPINIPISFEAIELPERNACDSMQNTLYLIESINKFGIKILVAPVRPLKYIELIRENTSCKYVFAHHGMPFWEASIKLDMARKRGQKSLAGWIEWLLVSYPKYTWFKRNERQFHKIYQKTYNEVDRYTVLCKEYKDEIVNKLSLNPANNKIRCIPNSERQIKNPNLNKKKQILFVGRLSYSDKRVDRLIDIWEKAYKMIPDWELIIVGNGEERTKLENIVIKKGLARINFAGATTDVQHYYNNASILCLVSTLEGWPLCLTEAQANGVVPIAFDSVAGIRHILAPSGINGYLIPPFNLNDFAKTLQALANDPVRLDTMRQNVLKKAKEYAIEVVGKQWMELFEDLYKE